MTLHRFWKTAGLLWSILLLTSVFAAAKTLPAYTMTIHEGFVCVQEYATGSWIYRSNVRAEMLSQRDQLLLETGIGLNSQAEFTRAVEDFCS